MDSKERIKALERREILSTLRGRTLVNFPSKTRNLSHENYKGGKGNCFDGAKTFLLEGASASLLLGD